ncbi:MAG: amidohydrolase family protein, partial [Candidatus Kapabacteria bacterium]|nr:amidohydrolase family protein [Candidatus Kapabacteria bacterium]
GLSEEDAVKGLTIWPAKIFGIDKNYGSIEIGKSATLFVSRGDALDGKGNNVVSAFIDGREIDLDNRQKRLAKKYRERSSR